MENSNENNNRWGCGYSMNTNMDCSYTPEGINAAFGYNSMPSSSNDLNCNCENNTDECSDNRNEVRRKMMKEIKCLNFAIIDLAEYLDTHPNDRKAICLHREYTNELNDLKDKYQRIFGPLTIYFSCNKWRWLEEPWPWERSDFNVDL